MASPNDCLRIIEEAAGGRLSDDELEELLTELQRIRKARISAGQLHDLEQAMFDAAEQIAGDVALAAQIEKRNRLINAVKQADLMALAKRADAAMDDPSLGLEAAMVGVNSPFAEGRASVDALTNGMLREYMGGLIADLRAGKLLALFNSGQLSREIARELWDLSLPQPKGAATNSKTAKAIAGAIHKYRRAAVQRENRAGAYIRFRSGYVTRQSHDMARMRRAGKEAWAREVAPKLDWDAMGIEPADRAKFLESAYEVLTTSVRKGQGPENDLMFAFKGPGNLAKKESASRVLLFKDADAWFDYNETFGRKSLNEALMDDFRRSAQATAIMSRFGTNPGAMFDKIRTELKEAYRSNPQKVDRLNRMTLDWQLAEIDGSVNIAGNHTLAGIGRTTRAIQSMAKLGGAFLSSISDIANVAGERRYQGRSIVDSWGDALRAPFDGLAAGEDKKRLGELIGVGIDGALGDFVSRFAAQDDAPGKVSKLMALFFKLNLLGPWTDAVKRGTGLMMSRDLGMEAGKAWADLPDRMRRSLAQYGMDARKWEVARLAAKDHDGKVYMLPGEVDTARGAPFTGLDDRQQQALRDEVKDALFAYINDRADFASPTPGARERALLRYGMPPGTPQGEAVRFLMQFKSFPVTVYSKVFGRDLYGHGAKSLRGALLRGEGDLQGLAAFIAGSSMLGYFAMQSKEIAKGREPRTGDPVDLVTASFLQGGGLGILGDFLLGETSRFGDSPIEVLAGPGVGAVSDALEVFQRFRADSFRGEPPDVGVALMRLAQSNLPFANLFYTQAAMNYLVFYHMQEAVNPSYLRRHERRIKRENNQRYFLPPSSVAGR